MGVDFLVPEPVQLVACWMGLCLASDELVCFLGITERRVGGLLDRGGTRGLCILSLGVVSIVVVPMLVLWAMTWAGLVACGGRYSALEQAARAPSFVKMDPDMSGGCCARA